MKCQTLLSLAFAGLVAAQSSNTSLADALGANNDTLSTLNSNFPPPLTTIPRC